jgi:molecular chaperone GrpE
MSEEKKKGKGEGMDIPAAKAEAVAENGSSAEVEGQCADSGVERLAVIEKELAEQRDKLLRSLADMDNFRKRTYKELQDARSMARIDSILPFLKVYDHFQLAVKAADEKHSFEVLHQGMEMILSEFSRALDELGLERIDALGKSFDPALHEAADQRSSEDVPEGQILEQWRCGYKMGEKVIQPALVVVSSGPGEEERAEKTDGESSAEEIGGDGK